MKTAMNFETSPVYGRNTVVAIFNDDEGGLIQLTQSELDAAEPVEGGFLVEDGDEECFVPTLLMDEALGRKPETLIAKRDRLIEELRAVEAEIDNPNG